MPKRVTLSWRSGRLVLTERVLNKQTLPLNAAEQRHFLTAVLHSISQTTRWQLLLPLTHCSLCASLLPEDCHLLFTCGLHRCMLNCTLDANNKKQDFLNSCTGILNIFFFIIPWVSLAVACTKIHDYD